DTKHLRVGYFGADTGAGAALIAAARTGIQGGIPIIGEPGPCAVVSRGGRPDLAGPYLPYVKTPTLLIVGGSDEFGLTINKEAYNQLNSKKEMVIIPNAAHFIDEPEALEEVARLSVNWFHQYLRSSRDEC